MMPARYLYLVDEDTGAEIRRWPLEDLDALQVLQRERRILAECSDGVVLRDSAFNRD